MKHSNASVNDQKINFATNYNKKEKKDGPQQIKQLQNYGCDLLTICISRWVNYGMVLLFAIHLRFSQTGPDLQIIVSPKMQNQHNALHLHAKTYFGARECKCIKQQRTPIFNMVKMYHFTNTLRVKKKTLHVLKIGCFEVMSLIYIGEVSF